MTENCSIGEISSSDCNLLTYSKKVGLKDISLFDLQDREILAWRTDIDITLIETVCLHHEQVFLLRCFKRNAVIHSKFMGKKEVKALCGKSLFKQPKYFKTTIFL